jgi:hypothetical protein
LILGVGRENKNEKYYNIGQFSGDIASTIFGMMEAEMGVGLEVTGITVTATGVGAPVGLGISAVGAVVVAHGVSVAGSGFMHSIDSGGKVARDLKIEREIRSKEKGIRSNEKTIKQHEDKINNPEKYIPDWDKRDPRYKEGIIKFWQKEIQGQKNQILEARLDISKLQKR